MSSAGDSAHKIRPLDELATIVANLKAQGKRVVLCHGVFDLLHIGHMRHFQSARRQGDVLVVTLTPDKWVNKGPLRPAFDETLRQEFIAGLECVDYVALNRWPTAVETIQLLRPSCFAKGAEFIDRSADVTGAVAKEEQAVLAVGGKMVFTDDLTFSSSNLINRYLSLISKEASEFIAKFALHHKSDDVLRYVEGARTLKVLTIGETIIDEYNFCETLGKSGKEPILAVRMLSTERFAGGVLAVANHVSGFCDRVGMLSMLGDVDSETNRAESFVREKLNPRVAADFLTMRGAPTIVKKRYIESYPFQKMFEVYLMNDDQDAAANSERFCAKLRELLPQFDLVVVTDYGHGLIDEAAVDVLCREAKCLAINTQANAGNYGFHTVSKYPRADYICLSEKELRLEARTRQKDIQAIVEQTAERHRCERVLVTRGEKGMLCWGRGEGFTQVPALAGHFTDRVGGDAVFAVTSLLMPQRAPAELMGLVGNAVGAMAVATIGNREPIERTPLVRFLISLFK